MRRHCVGTPWPTVTRSRAISRSVSAAVHGVDGMIVVMTFSISSHGRLMYPTCANGIGANRRSNCSPIAPAPSATAARLSWSNTAPFGIPVVPLVHTIATGSCGSSAGSVGAASAYAGASCERLIAVPRARMPGARRCQRARAARCVRGCSSISGGPSRGLMPDVIAPQPHRRLIADRIVDRGRQEQRDDVAPPHAAVGERAREPVRRAIPLGEGQARIRFDVRVMIRVFAATERSSSTVVVTATFRRARDAGPCRSRCAAASSTTVTPAGILYAAMRSRLQVRSGSAVDRDTGCRYHEGPRHLAEPIVRHDRRSRRQGRPDARAGVPRPRRDTPSTHRG